MFKACSICRKWRTERVAALAIVITLLAAFNLQGEDKILLVDPLQEGSFKNGSTFAINGWTVVNGLEANQWEVADFPGEYPKAIISADGGMTWSFDVNNPSVVHFYRDIAIPEDATEVYLSFAHFGHVTPLFDELRVYVVPTSTPVLPAEVLLFEPLKLKQKTRSFLITVDFQYTTLPVVPGSEIRLVFTWTNSGNGLGVQPPVGVSAIEVSYTPANPLLDEITWQNPLPQGNDHNSMIATNSMNAVSAGNGGTVGRTSDGGQNWEYIFNINGFRSNCVSLWRGSDDIFIVAQPNVLLRSADEGENWETRGEINTDAINVNAVGGSGDTLLAAGSSGSVFRSPDAGINWTPVPSGVSSELRAVSFGSSTDVLVGGGSGTLIKSSDGGQTFTILSTGMQDIYDIEAYDQNKYVAATLLGIHRSEDGGETWSVVPGTNFFTINDIAVEDSVEGAAVAGGGIIFHTLDGWNSVGTKFTGNNDDLLTSIALYPGSENVSIAGTGGTLLHTDDFSSFERLSSGPNVNDLHDVHFVTRDTIPDAAVTTHGWAVGQGGTVLHTLDGGINWTPQTSGVFGNLDAIGGFKEGTVMAVGSPGQHIRSLDGGNSWEGMEIPITLALNDIHLANSRHAIAVGLFGSVVTTMDQGQTWTPQTTGISSHLNAVDVLALAFSDTVPGDSFAALAVGDQGTIIRTSDGGSSWTSLISPASTDFNAAQMLDETTWYVAGEVGTFLRTDDSGENWTQFEVDVSGTVTADIQDLSFIGIDLGVISSADGQILRTADGGNTWDRLSSPVGHSLNAVYFFDPYSITSIGESGTIIHTAADTLSPTGIDGSVPPVAIPRQFSVEQNYPNPFNGRTIIGYSLQSRQHVHLAIYGLTGRKIRTLVNGSRPAAGGQTVIWDGRDDAGLSVASGIYFYRFKTPGAQIVKKMIVIE